MDLLTEGKKKKKRDPSGRGEKKRRGGGREKKKRGGRGLKEGGLMSAVLGSLFCRLTSADFGLRESYNIYSIFSRIYIGFQI